MSVMTHRFLACSAYIIFVTVVESDFAGVMKDPVQLLDPIYRQRSGCSGAGGTAGDQAQ